MKTILLGFVLLLTSTTFTNDPYIDKDEAKKAYEFLNKLRTDKSFFAQNLKSTSLYGFKQMPALSWNDTLAIVAERKALDMIKRKYFEHVDPDGYGINYYINREGYKLNPDFLEKKDDNSFESICYGVFSGEEAIKGLIIDENTPSLGHRKHLLGLGDWFDSLIDIGIGYAKVDSALESRCYVCVIIAKHSY